MALPDVFFAPDELFKTFLIVLADFGVFPEVTTAELDRYLSFLTTTKILMAAAHRGVNRRGAHEAIKEHTVAVVLRMRHGMRTNDFLDRLAAGSHLRLTRDEPGMLVINPLGPVGTVRAQVARVTEEVVETAATHPEATAYRPGAML